ncbi:MAG: thermonuclease family protein [Hydrotalea sp.]|nr:thermonuclease family protein [Hydrotalea sp.]
MKRLIAFILLVSFFYTACNSGSGERKPKVITSSSLHKDEFLVVKKVVDGDTFWAVDESGKELKIRLIGVDAPESRKTFKKEIGHFGKESKEYLTNLLIGKKIRLEYDISPTDQYGRTLAYVYLEDGTFVNAELLKNGFAKILTVPPNIKYVDEFVKLQHEARTKSVGLWKE